MLDLKRGQRDEMREDVEYVPVNPVTVKTMTIRRIPSTGPENAERYSVPVWNSSHVVR
jgi:hypothetical protein